MSALTLAQSCSMHNPPEPESCLHCASYVVATLFADNFLPVEESVYQEGTSDLANSFYPEIETSMHTVSRPSTAPVANMKFGPELRKRSRPDLTIAVGPESHFHSVVRREEHDFYTERLALSPHERPVFFAKRHDADHLALSPGSVSPVSGYRITLRGQGKKARQAKKKVNSVLSSGDKGKDETIQSTRKRRKVAAPRETK